MSIATQSQHPTVYSPLKPSSILIVGPSWVGDMVMAQSLFKVLKREQPKVTIDVLAPTWSEGLLQRMPEVRYIFPHTIEHGQLAWQERRRISQELRSQGYQQAIILPNSWKSALIPFWAKIPRRTGYRGEMRYGLLNDIRKLNKLILRKTVEQFVALGIPPNSPFSGPGGNLGQQVPNPRLSPGQVEKVLQRLGLEYPRQPTLAICPGAEYGPAKQWQPADYVTCAKRKLSEGWKVWIFGSPKDASLGARIQALAGEGCINLCGQTTLPEAVDLLSLMQFVITNDSGLMHVAAALDKPMIAIYGSSNPGMTPPLSNNAHILYLGLKCSPCYQRTCPKKHLKCLRDIKPEQVLDMLKSYE
ncbi:MAG: lipopolysaccharide heptosyltransferase II [Candidatus Parabeggiatoa sp. nov. 2]|nr:MAG: lipopolysaccharide heptosyltransferase II [Beggiatoa sp. 4572_84]RKZ63269.1 MAG: lipopolysaccharide heptosyltransferase II [Gammaproteobacteria bacterium]HEC85735.1 lipopolysaccharide heptosyltransferase II [Thioploca sp.]